MESSCNLKSVGTDPNLVPAEMSAPPPAAPTRDPVWSGWDVFFTALLAFGASLVLAVLVGLVLGLRPKPGEFQPEMVRAAITAQMVAYALVAVYVYSLVVYHYRQPFLTAIRWNWPPTPVLWVLAGIGMSLAVMVISRFLPVPRDLPVERYFTDRRLAFLLVFFGTAVAPLVEEVFFRGFLYPVLRSRMGIPVATAFTAGIFAVIHGQQVDLAWAPLMMLFGVGLTLTVVRERTGSVSTTFLMHLGYNATLFLLLALATKGFTEAPKVAP
jgi:membrane protease YdiL (CAAX protease family)